MMAITMMIEVGNQCDVMGWRPEQCLAGSLHLDDVPQPEQSLSGLITFKPLGVAVSS